MATQSTLDEASTVAIDRPQPRLGLLDAASIIIGIIIGSGFLQSSPMVALNAGSAEMAVLLWIVGGLIALIGAACYAELATLFPSDGGDYTYLTKAYGQRTGFLFVWISLLVVRPGNIGAMAMVFATYADKLIPLDAVTPGISSQWTWAALAVAVLTAINAIGLQGGRRTQNLLTGVKVVGFLLLIVAGAIAAFTPRPVAATDTAPVATRDIGLAMVFILFAYGGWADVSYVAAEVRNPQRNLWRSLLLGTSAVTVIYVLGTIGFFAALGYSGAANSEAVATEAVERAIGPLGASLISLLICIACLGSINGMIFTGARVFYAAGQDHRIFGWLGDWNGRRGVPMRSLLLQSGITLGLLTAFGMGGNAFERLVNFTTPPFWIFFALAGFSLILFRDRGVGAKAERYRVPLYPLTPLLFVGSSLYLLYASLEYAWANKTTEAWWTISVIVLGGIICFLPKRSRRAGSSEV